MTVVGEWVRCWLCTRWYWRYFEMTSGDCPYCCEKGEGK